jgi:hypothetical protein
MPRNLDELLSAHKVEPAPQALVDRIVARAAEEASPAYVARGRARVGGLLAMAAVLGFWLGHLQARSVVAVAHNGSAATSQERSSFESVIAGPESIDDIVM